jgi:hypothetical protein
MLNRVAGAARGISCCHTTTETTAVLDIEAHHEFNRAVRWYSAYDLKHIGLSELENGAYLVEGYRESAYSRELAQNRILKHITDFEVVNWYHVYKANAFKAGYVESSANLLEGCRENR